MQMIAWVSGYQGNRTSKAVYVNLHKSSAVKEPPDAPGIPGCKTNTGLILIAF